MQQKKLFIPQICRNSSLLITVIVTELAVILFWLVNAQNVSASAFGLWSLYGLWLVLITALLLCFFRSIIASLPYILGVLCVVFIFFTVLISIEAFIAYQLPIISEKSYLNWQRVIRIGLVGLISLVFVLRLFSFLEVLENRNKAEVESRILALQSRINPHFLFNSLNTISELTIRSPEQAEKAINSLSLLFRAGLENTRVEHSLEHELNLCKRYLELEKWRFDDRLSVTWNVEIDNPSAWRVPKLILQPLIENAIVHGKQIDGRIMISLDLRESTKHLSLMIENKIGISSEENTGHGIALNNIRERLVALYDDQQTFRIKQVNDNHSVLMRIPKVIKAN